MAAFVAFELWIPLLAIIIRALVGPTVPTAVQAVSTLFGLAVPAVVGLALSDYLADRRGLVRPYQPKRRPSETEQDEGLDEPIEDENEEDRDLDDWDEEEAGLDADQDESAEAEAGDQPREGRRRDRRPGG
jgi:hypothetical protein